MPDARAPEQAPDGKIMQPTLAASPDLGDRRNGTRNKMHRRHVAKKITQPPLESAHDLSEYSARPRREGGRHAYGRKITQHTLATAPVLRPKLGPLRRGTRRCTAANKIDHHPPRLGGGSWRAASPDPKRDGLDACAMTRSSQQPWPATRRSKHLKTTRWAAWQHGEKGPRSNDGDKGRGSPAM